MLENLYTIIFKGFKEFPDIVDSCLSTILMLPKAKEISSNI